ncbi:hypothetical protein [Streptomyces sp. ML-6]|uniref:hypothetical protein n=1 Tax=Streptomyces sp. ML-6 TaxID=2982693 RepID=UPI0024C0DF70|nr:hypothetical protein [Streptomyces sp. ML-6]MDK0525051.1 hypothetical protein [Streptomyces sp. ML-6]
MAIQSIVPYTVAGDMMTLEEISTQLKTTGHPASVSTIRRWIERDGLRTERYRRRDYVSYSDILLAHQEAVARRG